MVGIEVHVRAAKPEDAASVIAWFPTHAEAVLWGGPAVPEHFDATWFAHEISATPDIYRVAYTPHDPVVGVYGLRPFAQEQRMHIIRVAVAPVHRDKGVSGLLMADALATVRAQKGLTVSLSVYGSNALARKIYENLGFQASEMRDAPEDISGVSVYMERPVS